MSKLNLSARGVWGTDTDEYVNFTCVQDYVVDDEPVAYVAFGLRRCRWEVVISVRAGNRELFVTEEAAKKYVEREWARYVEDECE